MLLELITGRPPIDLTGEMEDSLVDWVRNLLLITFAISKTKNVNHFFCLQARPLCLKGAQDGDYSQLADPRLEGIYDQQEMARMASCAAAAIRHSARRRPKMSQVQKDKPKPFFNSFVITYSAYNLDDKLYETWNRLYEH